MPKIAAIHANMVFTATNVTKRVTLGVSRVRKRTRGAHASLTVNRDILARNVSKIAIQIAYNARARQPLAAATVKRATMA